MSSTVLSGTPRSAHCPCAVAELAAGDARTEEAAAVAGTLIDRDEFDGLHLLDVLQRQF